MPTSPATMNQTLRDIGATAAHLRRSGCSEAETLGSLPLHFGDESLEVYNDLRNAYAATYAAYSLGEASTVSRRITAACNGDDRAAALADLANEYGTRINVEVVDRIVRAFDNEVRNYGSRIVNFIAGDCSAILA